MATNGYVCLTRNGETVNFISLPSNVKKIEEKWLNHFGKLSFFK